MNLTKLITIFLFVGSSLFLLISFTNPVEAHDTASLTGHVWMIAPPDGEFVYLPDIVIYREDNLGPRYPRISDCIAHYEAANATDPEESCHYVHGGVESLTDADGRYYFGPNHPEEDGYIQIIPVCSDPTDLDCLNDERGGRGTITCDVFEGNCDGFDLIMNNPEPIENCWNDSSAKCPSGDWGETTDAGGVCENLNQCGLNCGLNPHGLRASFPKNYTFFDNRFSDPKYDGLINFDPNDLKKGGGRWMVLGPTVDGDLINVPSSAPELWLDVYEGNPDYSPFGYTNKAGTWDGYNLGEYFEVYAPNDSHHYGYNFVWIPPDPEPVEEPNRPPNIITMTNDIDTGRSVGTPSDEDNGLACDDQNPVTYTMEVVDPDGSDDIDFIDMSLATINQLPPNQNPMRWPLRILFAKDWVRNSGRGLANNTFFVRDRDTLNWSADRCFDKNRNTQTGNIFPAVPTDPIDYLTARFTTPEDAVNYSLWCYAYDEHQWSDASYALGSFDGTVYDVWYLNDEIEIYGAKYEATLLGATDKRPYIDSTYVAYDRNSNRVKAQFVVKFGTSNPDDIDHNIYWNDLFKDLWRVRDAQRAEDSTADIPGETVYEQNLTGETYYFHTKTETKADMSPPIITLENPQNAGGNNLSLAYNVKDNFLGSGVDRVIGEALNEEQSSVVDISNITPTSQNGLYKSEYTPALNEEVVGGDIFYAPDLVDPNDPTVLIKTFNPRNPLHIKFSQWTLWDRIISNPAQTRDPAGVDFEETIDMRTTGDSRVNFYASAIDLACNRSSNPSSSTYVSFDPWMATRGGAVYSGGSINGDLIVQDIDDATDIDICTSSTCPFPGTFGYPNNYLRREAVLSSEWLATLGGITTDHMKNFESPVSAYSSAGYNDRNYKAPDGTLQEWYPYLMNNALDTIDLNPNKINLNELTSDDSVSEPYMYCAEGDLCMIDVTPNSGTLTFSGPYECNRRTVIFVDGNLILENTIQNSDTQTNGCIFIVNGDVTIDPYQSLDATTGSDAYYEQIEAYIISDGEITINDSPQGWGLQVWGGLIGMGKNGRGFTIDRSLNSDQNEFHPSIMIHHDPRYMHIIKDLFSNDEPTYTKEVGYKD